MIQTSKAVAGRQAACIAAAVALAFLVPRAATAQLRVVSYNTAGAVRTGMDTVLTAIGTDSKNGIARPLDVFALQEQGSQNLPNNPTDQMAALLNSIYDPNGPGMYQVSTSNPGGAGGDVALVYNSDTVQLISEQVFGTTGGSAQARQGVLYQLRPVGYGAEADFYLFNDHYKAGSTVTDENRRDVEATKIRELADALGEGTHIIYAGDHNAQEAAEPAIQTLFASGAGQAEDPLGLTIVDIGGNPFNVVWNNNSGVRFLHTQSPTDPGLPGTGGLTTGGMDDRFDFQFVTSEMMDGEGMSYIGQDVADNPAAEDSYWAFGNNGSHSLNDYINDASNTAQPSNVLEALASVTDHLPVVADYQLPAKMSITTPTVAPRMVVGADPNFSFTIENTAPVSLAIGADELDYTAAGTGDLTGGVTSLDSATGGGQTHNFTFDTATAGSKSGSFFVTSPSQGLADPNYSENVNYDVVSHADGSFEAGSDVETKVIDIGDFFVGDGLKTQQYSVHNRAADPNNPTDTSDLRLLSTSGSGDTAQLDANVFTPLSLAAGANLIFAASMDTNSVGDFSASWDIDIADEDIPGGVTHSSLTLDLSGRVTIVGDFSFNGVLAANDIDLFTDELGTNDPLADLDDSGLVDQDDFDELVHDVFQTEYGDGNLDLKVDIGDFTLWGDGFGTVDPGWGDGDYNNDGFVDIGDFTLWGDMFGFDNSGGPGPLPSPEPSTAVLAVLAVGGLLASSRGKRSRGIRQK